MHYHLSLSLICISLSIFIYIYIEREREVCVCVCVRARACVCVCVCVCVYTRTRLVFFLKTVETLLWTDDPLPPYTYPFLHKSWRPLPPPFNGACTMLHLNSLHVSLALSRLSPWRFYSLRFTSLKCWCGWQCIILVWCVFTLFPPLFHWVFCCCQAYWSHWVADM